MNSLPIVISIAVPVPVYGTFDYLPALDTPIADHTHGKRVLIPFGKRNLIGVIIANNAKSSTPANKLKRISQLLDRSPALSDIMMELLLWSASYYCHPIGDCIQSALPSALRRTKEIPEIVVVNWRRTSKPFEGRRNAIRQQAILKTVSGFPDGVEQAQLSALGIPPRQLKVLEQSGYLSRDELDPLSELNMRLPKALPVELNKGQHQAVIQLSESLSEFRASLLQGITGSGKTEVYIKLVEKIIKQDMQALVLIPEINLTPQTLSRFQQQLATPVAALHSGMSEREKYTTWSLAKRGLAKVVIGTRSAVFTPFMSLGIIIVDEEHDASFKQMDGFRYSARDLAVKRAQLENCNVVLGSATPSLESIHNAQQQKYHWVKLNKRAGSGIQPNMALIDIRSRPLMNGCSQLLLDRIRQEITAGHQVIIFQNRRGFSPTLMCNDCGTLIQCNHCDARMTVHSKPPLLHCHHCDFKRAIPGNCEQCNSAQLSPVGVGTERLEHGLRQSFPDTEIIRIDRDNIKHQDDMAQLITHIDQGEPCLLVGTQMLAKGHDFHNVTMVAIIDADASFFSADFRAIERSAQQLLQVAGRTGRGAKAGQVLIQTRQPEHPLFEAIIASNYEIIASTELNDRKTCELPPFSKMVSIRADAHSQAQTIAALQSLHREILTRLPAPAHLHLSGPIAANIARKSGIYRSYLHLYTSDSKLRTKILGALPSLLRSKTYRQMKLSIDVDPLEYL